MRRPFLGCLIVVAAFTGPSWGQVPSSEQAQVIVPPIRRVEPPSSAASADELEKRGDELRANKDYLDALDYYREALKKEPKNPSVHNKAGICQLQLRRPRDAAKYFQRAIKNDQKFADAYNNLGVAYYEEQKYGKAIKLYQQAIQLQADMASYYNNLGAAYFSKKQFEQAVLAYNRALELDPDVLERTSRTGVTAQLPSPEDRARYDYVVAKLYAKMGAADRSLEHLRRALEEGYKGINDVYKDAEFTQLRKDPRFNELMATRPPTIPE